MIRSLQRLSRAPVREWPFRARQFWDRSTDRWWRPARTPPGPDPTWPWPDPGVPADPPDRGDASARWPRRPGFALDLSREDPHDAWRETRLQDLAARAWRGDAHAAQLAEAYVRAWPPGWGVGWASGLEAAVRLVSLVRISACFPSRRLRRAVHAHAQWILRHPSHGSSAFNHRVAELGALALAHRVLPEVLPSPGPELADVLRRQLHPDGAGVEQSAHYLAFDLEWALLARRCGVPDLDDPIDRAARFLAALLDPTGATPQLGDDDGGFVIPAGDEPYVASVVRAAGFGDGPPDARAWALSDGGPGRPLPTGSAHFPHGGITVLARGAWSVIVDHGPLGEPGLGAHGHSDALAVYVHGPRGAIVVGRGTGRYTGAVRRFHRGAGAHPVLVVDGVDPSEPSDHPFLWRRRADAILEAVDLEQSAVWARHEGYARRGVTHRRSVRLEPGLVRIVDEIGGRGPHHVALLWPLAPGLSVEDGLVIVAGAVREARLRPPPDLSVRVVRGGPRPGLGWHSDRYGAWVEAQAIVCERVLALPARLETVIELG